jgi:hypothetical protein
LMIRIGAVVREEKRKFFGTRPTKKLTTEVRGPVRCRRR